MRKKFLILPLIISLLLIFNLAFAGLVPCGGEGNPCQPCDFLVLINNIIEFVLQKVVPSIAVLMLVIGGFMMMISHVAGPEALPSGSQGGPVLLGQAKKVITTALIGLVIIYTAYALVGFFLDVVGVADWTGLKSWFEISCP